MWLLTSSCRTKILAYCALRFLSLETTTCVIPAPLCPDKLWSWGYQDKSLRWYWSAFTRCLALKLNEAMPSGLQQSLQYNHCFFSWIKIHFLQKLTKNDRNRRGSLCSHVCGRMHRACTFSLRQITAPVDFIDDYSLSGGVLIGEISWWRRLGWHHCTVIDRTTESKLMEKNKTDEWLIHSLLS